MKSDHLPTAYPYTNVILYGPPGTGKTYHARNYAIAAIQNVLPEALTANREQINQRYQQYVDEGRIQFVTFHQSFSYEDFMEGIKPDLEGNRTELRYVLQNGIFKRMCLQATQALLQAPAPVLPTRLPTAPLSQSRSLEFEELYTAFLSEQMSLLRRQVDVSYSSKTKREVRLLSVNAKKNLLLTTGQRGQAYVVTQPKLRRLYEAFSEVEQIRRVYTDLSRVIGSANATVYWTVFSELKEFEKTVEMAKDDLPDETLPEAADEDALSQALNILDWAALTPEMLQQADRYVLIIDEINRGNISQIFGELITLIEPDKRGGHPEAISVQLPYSKTTFTVPPNLYLIGTMNTTDRNVEALDTALRRRFSFVEKTPDYDLLEKKFGQQAPHLARMLHVMNRRIAKLLGSDYAIGHAYFMDLPDACDTQGLKSIFQNRLIPLLQEYFMGHRGKVELVIGEDFFEKGLDNRDSSTPFFAESDWAATHYEVQEELASYQTYPLKNLQQMSNEQFVRALTRIYQRS